MNTNKKMNDLKIGDRVRVISIPNSFTAENPKIKMGLMGTVKDLDGAFVGVEFDEDMGGHNGSWNGKQGYCWYIEDENLEKIDETKGEVEEMDIAEETKTNTLKEKVLEVLREEIGVAVSEEFDVYKNGEKQWTCKFEENGHLTRCYEDGKFRVTFIWKYWVFHFDKYVFKKKPLFPIKEKPYFYVQMRLDNNGNAIYDGVDYVYWYGKDVDIAMLITGNCFKTEKEAKANKEKVIERINKFIEQAKGEK